MAQNDLDQRHLETLDRDLNRFSALEQATAYASRPMMGLGVSLVFILLAGLVAFYLFGQTATRPSILAELNDVNSVVSLRGSSLNGLFVRDDGSHT